MSSAEDLARVGSATEHRPVTYREMVNLLIAVANEDEANYRAFGHPSRLERAQAFDFVGAAHCQLCAVSALEAATDAYLRACRAAQEAESRG